MNKIKKYTFTINYHNGRKVIEEYDNKEDRDKQVKIVEEGLNYRLFLNPNNINQKLNKTFVTIEG